jgi:hypothetical protein
MSKQGRAVRPDRRARKRSVRRAIEKRENAKDDPKVELEDETGELTLSIARRLFMKKPSAYNVMFNGNYQERMKTRRQNVRHKI